MLTQDRAALIGQRLRAARERAGLTQDQLAGALGLEHRQSLAAIEAGERRLSAEELLRAVKTLGVDLDYFTDAFRLVGEGELSFRAHRQVSDAVLDQFEDRAGRWIAAWRELGAQEGAPGEWIAPRLTLTPRSSFEEAWEAAEQVVARWGLGERPAFALREAMERELGAVVLHVDAPEGISGAATQLPRLNAVLVNRAEPVGRRHYDLAHECFHLLTWVAMPPERMDWEHRYTGKAKRVEQLADNFASALLMPAAGLRERWDAVTTAGDAGTLADQLNAVATDYGVSAVALKWRLVALGRLDRADLTRVDDQQLVANGGRLRENAAPALFSAPFVARIARALGAGRLSVKRTASLLGLSLAGLASLLRDYGLQPEFEA